MRERITLGFPYLLAAALPLVGIILAIFRATEQKYHDAAVLTMCALLGALIFFLVLS